MSSELHYLDIILKMEKFTLMSSEFEENCLYFCDFACIFARLTPVFLLKIDENLDIVFDKLYIIFEN